MVDLLSQIVELINLSCSHTRARLVGDASRACIDVNGEVKVVPVEGIEVTYFAVRRSDRKGVVRVITADEIKRATLTVLEGKGRAWSDMDTTPVSFDDAKLIVGYASHGIIKLK